MKLSSKKEANIFEKFASTATRATGSTPAFMGATLILIVWLALGPVFHFSDTWQLVINTFTTIVTFLMVFLIQKTQNKDSLAIQLKLNELVASNRYASNRLIDSEDLTEAELRTLTRFYTKLAELAKSEATLTTSHSIEEAMGRHKAKKTAQHPARKNHPPRTKRPNRSSD